MRSGKRNNRSWSFLFLGAVVCMLLTTVAFPQGTTGSIDVTVTDNSGSVVPGAGVVAVNTGTGADFHAQTNEQGRALFPWSARARIG